MTAVCACPACDKPTHNGFLCTTCITTLENDLKAVPDLLTDLEVTITRQDKIGDRQEGGRPSERPLPLRLGPMEARRALGDALLRWVCAMFGDRFRDGSRSIIAEPLWLAQYLINNLGDIQLSEQAGDLADEIGYRVIGGQRAVDKPLQLVYAGPCDGPDGCTADLYAHPRRNDVACRSCGLVYEIAPRRRWLLEHAEDQLLTAVEISRALPGLLQQKLTAAMVRGWAHRGRLTPKPPHPADRAKNPRYRVGDVMNLINETQRETLAS